MEILLAVLSILLLSLYLREHCKNRKLEKDYQYINSRLIDIAGSEENRYILVPTDNKTVKESAEAINNLLELFYNRQIDYHRSEKAILQVFTNISPDLRTPITALKGYIEMIYLQSGKESLSPAFRQIIGKTWNNAKELVHSVNNLFNMAKIQSGDMVLNLQKTDLTQMCHEIILEYYDLLDRENFRVEVDIEDQPLYADADPEALRRILKNLIDNAVKYGSRGKFLGLSLYEKGNQICIAVEDHGPGISDKEKEQIFTRAYTADRKKGNGLGLAIAQGLAGSMGGLISVHSVPGVKTVFILELQG